MPRRPRMGVLACVLAFLAVAACGGSQDHSSMEPDGTGTAPGMDHGTMPGTSAASGSTAVAIPEAADHNEHDVRFAREMILHHAQAIEMADLALTRSTDPRIRELAERIKAAQAPEIEQLRNWLRTWGQAAPEPGGAQDMTGMQMPSMMSGEDMALLERSSGPAFDRTFLEQMIRHHEGAVTMAQTQLRDGEYGAARAMAASILESQSAEIAEMRGLLGSS